MYQYEYKVDCFTLYFTYICVIKRESGYSQILKMENSKGIYVSAISNPESTITTNRRSP